MATFTRKINVDYYGFEFSFSMPENKWQEYCILTNPECSQEKVDIGLYKFLAKENIVLTSRCGQKLLYSPGFRLLSLVNKSSKE